MRATEAPESDFSQSRQALKQRDSYEEMWELTVGLLR